MYKKNYVRQYCEAYIEVEFLDLPDKDIRTKILDLLAEPFNCGCGISTVSEKPNVLEFCVACSDDCGLDDDGSIDGGFETEDEWAVYAREKITDCIINAGCSYIGTNTIKTDFESKESLAEEKEEELAYQKYLDKLDDPHRRPI